MTARARFVETVEIAADHNFGELQLLRRGPCSDLDQPMVRIRMLAGEAGLLEVSAGEVVLGRDGSARPS
jgi:hypothetical protein